MTDSVVGIDFGTTNSLACVYSDGRLQIPETQHLGQRSAHIPSIVAIDLDGELLTGYDALAYADTPGRGVKAIKRKMGEKTDIELQDRRLSPPQIAATILKRVLQNVQTLSNKSVTEAVISVPAYFPEPARRATYEAAKLAGINILRLINEPTAAALTYAFEEPDVDETILVFDFGGGTLDITILRLFDRVLNVRISHGDPKLGGTDFDNIMRSLVQNKFLLEHPSAKLNNKAVSLLKKHSEKAKIDLSNRKTAEIFFPNFVVYAGEPLDLEVEVTRTEFETAASPLLERARSLVFAALDKAKLTVADIDKVLLVGGSTYMPCVQSMLREVFGEAVCAMVDPDLAVAKGAAIYAATIKGLVERPITVSDVAPYGLGIKVISYKGDPEQSVYEPLIVPNTKIPFSVSRSNFLLQHAGQSSFEIELYQDPIGNADLEDAIFTGAVASITNIPPSESGRPHRLEIEFQYNPNGIVNLRATIPATRQLVDVVYATAKEAGKDVRVTMSRQTMQWKTKASIKNYLTLVSKAEAVLEGLNGMPRLMLERAIRRVQSVVETDGNVEIAIGKLNDLLFALELGDFADEDR